MTTSQAELHNRLAAAAERLRAYLDGTFRYKAYRGRAPEGVPTMREDLDIVLSGLGNLGTKGQA